MHRRHVGGPAALIAAATTALISMWASTPALAASTTTPSTDTTSSATSPPSQGGTPDAPVPPASSNGPHPTLPADAAPPACCPAPGQMAHGNGPVLKGFTRVALIFWGPNWNGDGRLAPVLNMFSHLGPNAWTDILLEYWDNWSSTDDTGYVFGGSWTDLASAPAATYSVASVAAEVQRAFNVGALGYDPNTLYLVYPNNGAHTDQSGACGWHYWNGNYGSGFAYGDVDYGTPGCQISVSGASGDSYTQELTKVGLHEFAEGVTDPFGTAWGNGQNGQEIGDLCNGNLITVNFGGTVYAAQQLWSNNAGGCIGNRAVTYSSKWITQSYTPNPMNPRSYYNVQLVVQNTGNVQWPVRSVLRLGTDRLQDHCSD